MFRNLWMLLILWIPCAAAADQVRPTLGMQREAIKISGVTPGGSVAIFALFTESRKYFPEQREVSAVLVDADGDGSVTHDTGSLIPSRAIVFAVDMTNGAWNVLTTPGYEFQFVELSPAALVSRSEKHVALRRTAAVADVLHVRPGRGAWKHRSGDGGPADGDGRTDGTITLSAETFRPLGGSGATDGELRPNDVIIVVDSLRRQYLAHKFGK